jgi:hypothetical protein
MVFNSTFNNISVILWRSVFLQVVTQVKHSPVNYPVICKLPHLFLICANNHIAIMVSSFQHQQNIYLYAFMCVKTSTTTQSCDLKRVSILHNLNTTVCRCKSDFDWINKMRFSGLLYSQCLYDNL